MRFAARFRGCAGNAAVMMPRGSADVRGEHWRRSVPASRAAHDAESGTLIERADAGSSQFGGLALANLLREMRRQRDLPSLTPPSLIARPV